VVDWSGDVFAGCLPQVQLFVRAYNGYFALLGPRLGGGGGGDLGTTYDVHLRLIGKRIVDFLLVLIELFH